MYNCCPALFSNGIVDNGISILFHPLLFVIIQIIIIINYINYKLEWLCTIHTSLVFRCEVTITNVTAFSPSTVLALSYPFTRIQPLIYISIDVFLLVVLNRIVIVGFRIISPTPPQPNLFHSIEKYIYCYFIYPTCYYIYKSPPNRVYYIHNTNNGKVADWCASNHRIGIVFNHRIIDAKICTYERSRANEKIRWNKRVL